MNEPLYFEESSLKSAKESASIFESMMLLHLTVLCELLTPKARIYYWRTVGGKEVDFVLEYGKRLIAVEVKLSTSPNYRDTEGIKSFNESLILRLISVLLLLRTDVFESDPPPQSTASSLPAFE